MTASPIARPTFDMPARVHLTSDPALHDYPTDEPVRSTVDARVHAVRDNRAVWSPTGCDWVTASADIDDVEVLPSAAHVMRGRGWIPLTDILGR